MKVREHKVLGPYVDGLSQLAVTSFEVCFFKPLICAVSLFKLILHIKNI